MFLAASAYLFYPISFFTLPDMDCRPFRTKSEQEPDSQTIKLTSRPWNTGQKIPHLYPNNTWLHFSGFMGTWERILRALSLAEYNVSNTGGKNGIET